MLPSFRRRTDLNWNLTSQPSRWRNKEFARRERRFKAVHRCIEQRLIRLPERRDEFSRLRDLELKRLQNLGFASVVHAQLFHVAVKRSSATLLTFGVEVNHIFLLMPTAQISGQVAEEMRRCKCDAETALKIVREPEKADVHIAKMNRDAHRLFENAKGKRHDLLDRDRDARSLHLKSPSTQGPKSVWAIPSGLPSLGKR